MGREDEIRLLAYQIWVDKGSCHGYDIEHWIKAELIWEGQQKPKRISNGAKSKPKRADKQKKQN